MGFAQKSDIGNWLIYIGNQKINKNWSIHNEIQYRSYNLIDDTNQLLLRTGIGYNLTENNNTILLGYGFINTQKYVPISDDKLAINEHRIFQQFINRQRFNRLYIQHRYRIEERFLPNDFQMRFRYFLGVNVPLNKETMDKNAFYLSAYNEVFINTENPLFDRNRLYGALGYVINENIKIEAGFMAQTVENSNRNQFQIAIFNTIPFNNNN
ncbi:DUF2490 domain-containing protein [Flavobacterium cellulosilyticum]|uniref:DUF2490 domain-containing protein n=1 Tax=Flavobacterium cellulosilyticum TaxID=2541731 RepID=A0A4R5CEW3_9FLAO|nr:DUF2490 domain-containing protein [Flavobacterium cellulosilyticum]TDD95754.1 DUF2490 domain-containing protein [Flavobacterium cellulosilyticum]